MKKKKGNEKSTRFIKMLNRTADSIQQTGGKTEKVEKVYKIKRIDALRKAGKLLGKKK